MPFAEEVRSYSDTRKRTATDYVKFSPSFRVVLRMLNPQARTVWKHWIDEANGGRGLTANCPNTSAGMTVCPIEKSVASLPRDDEERRAKNARRKFIVNVLDRTPYTTCNSCGTPTPGRKCISCQADLKNHDFAPLNKVKILEQGPRLFNQTLNAVERMQKEDFDLEITEYDITFMTQGEGRDRQITAQPQKAEALNSEWLVDPETGEAQKLYDLDILTEPSSIEEIEAMARGATIDELNAIRGVA
jgi:hypothetical protein